jgi:hypothetical protein
MAEKAYDEAVPQAERPSPISAREREALKAHKEAMAQAGKAYGEATARALKGAEGHG